MKLNALCTSNKRFSLFRFISSQLQPSIFVMVFVIFVSRLTNRLTLDGRNFRKLELKNISEKSREILSTVAIVIHFLRWPEMGGIWRYFKRISTLKPLASSVNFKQKKSLSRKLEVSWEWFDLSAFHIPCISYLDQFCSWVEILFSPPPAANKN